METRAKQHLLHRIVHCNECYDLSVRVLRVMTRSHYLSYFFPIENGLKQGDALSPLLFNFALEYAIRNVQETK